MEIRYKEVFPNEEFPAHKYPKVMREFAISVGGKWLLKTGWLAHTGAQ